MLIKILAAVAPVLFLLCYIYMKDKKAPEPTEQLFKAFRYGVLSAICVMVVMSPFGATRQPVGFLQCMKVSFFEAGIPEEFFKWLFLYILIWRSPQFDEYIDGIVYAVFISMGFACLENIMYVLPGSMGTAVSRALLSVPAHFLFAVIMGYYFSMGKFHPEERTRYMMLSLLLPIVGHGLFDTFAFWMDSLGESRIYTAVFVFFIACDIWLWRRCTRLIRKSVLMSDEARAEAEALAFVQAQEAAESLPAALPVSGEWADTPIAIFRVKQDGESTTEAEGLTYKLLIECKDDAKIIINERDAFFAKGGTNYRLTLPAGEYTLRAVNLARYEQMISKKVNLTENRRVTVAFSAWERIPAWVRTVTITLLAILLYRWFVYGV